MTQRFVARFASGLETPTLARHQLDDWLPASVGEGPRGALRLLVSELVTNCVRHARAGSEAPVELSLRLGDAGVRVEVRDSGPGFRPQARPTPRGADGGYGLFLVERMASRWGVDSEGGTRVWFELEFEPAA
ncbi:MAG TPA: ATP-binding protein [Solirubrobacteraceae bacterium]|nr:ATP-binding protein [Solirubrobacteraceae bacterium]